MPFYFYQSLLKLRIQTTHGYRHRNSTHPSHKTRIFNIITTKTSGTISMLIEKIPRHPRKGRKQKRMTFFWKGHLSMVIKPENFVSHLSKQKQLNRMLLLQIFIHSSAPSHRRIKQRIKDLLQTLTGLISLSQRNTITGINTKCHLNSDSTHRIKKCL